ncbi:MAG: deoxyribose-phosphate aldolase [Myxococcales bacterium]|nr:deoxyribose-phosphate aldolase [Myxococcales bacterium]MDH3483575.1 deoxyribose-phosphate aldolase [Myxococcales bacterium]
MRRDLAAVIDHTLLRPDAVPPDFERLCAEAAHYNLGAICVNSTHVRRCRELLGSSGVKVVATAGFPLGAASAIAKAAEACQAVRDGADEIDMVCQIGDLKSGQERAFIEDIRKVVGAAEGRVVKVILETCLLSDDEKRQGALWVRQAGAAFVKTSTGFSVGGATEKDVRLLRGEVGPDFGVKAAGGIREAEGADRMIAAGANRLGTSAGVAIVTEYREGDAGY